jgi:hypothetical protein
MYSLGSTRYIRTAILQLLDDLLHGCFLRATIQPRLHVQKPLEHPNDWSKLLMLGSRAFSQKFLGREKKKGDETVL